MQSQGITQKKVTGGRKLLGCLESIDNPNDEYEKAIENPNNEYERVAFFEKYIHMKNKLNNLHRGYMRIVQKN